MKSKITIALSTLVFLLSLVFLCLFRVNSNSSVWKGWTVLCVEESIDESEVLLALEKIGIKNVVSESCLHTKLTSPVVPVLPNNFSQYEQDFIPYFYSSDMSKRLYYIKKPYSSSKLKNLPFLFSVDLPNENLSILPFVSLAFCCVLIFFYKNKLKYFILSFPFLLLCFLNAGLSSTFICIFVCSSFLIFSFFEGRINSFYYSAKNPFLIIMLFASFVCALLGSWKMILLYFACWLCSASLYILYDIFCEKVFVKLKNKFSKTKVDETQTHFSYKKIVTSRFYPRINKKVVYSFYAISSIILICGTLSMILPFVKKNADISIPVPEKTSRYAFNMSGYQKSSKKYCEFPRLVNFVDRNWNAQKLEVSSLNKDFEYTSPIKKGEKITEVFYTENETTNKIEKNERDVLVFDNNFVKSSIKKINRQEELSIEKVLADQKSFCSVEFCPTKNNFVIYLIITTMGLFFSVSSILLSFVGKKIGVLNGFYS